MKYWIVATKHSRDPSVQNWSDNKWTSNSFIKNKKFYPSKCKDYFSQGDICLLRLFVEQKIIANFTINSEGKTDSKKDTYYDIIDVSEWEYPIKIHTLPEVYKKYFDRNPVKELNQRDHHELTGIKHFVNNLRLNYKNKLHVKFPEKQMEELLDSFSRPLKQLGLDIIDRQVEYTKGNRIDLLCKDEYGDLVVVELKKDSANETIGQLARYLCDVKEEKATSTQKVRGIILSLQIDEQLVKAARAVDFNVILYQIMF